MSERDFIAHIGWPREAIVQAVFWSAVAMAATVGVGALSVARV